MGRGTLLISAMTVLELIADALNLDVLRQRLLLPDHYQLSGVQIDRDRNEMILTISSPETPDNARVLLTYQIENEHILLGKHKTILTDIDMFLQS